MTAAAVPTARPAAVGAGAPPAPRSLDDRPVLGTRIRGLEFLLPAGETVHWVGAPDRRAVARHVFHVRKLVVYFTLLLLLPGLGRADGLAAIAQAAVWIVPLGIATVVFATVLASLVARTSVYALTDRRLVMRVGIALPITVNVPLHELDAADLRPRPDGRGDISLTLGGKQRIAWLLLWPHVRPWRFANPQPTLLGVENAAHVGQLLGEALETTRERSAADAADAGADAVEPRRAVRLRT